MNKSIRIVAQIASIFGVVFVVFAVIAAIVDYIGIMAQYGQYGGVTVQVLQYSLLAAMLPYLLYAALSFTVAGVIMRSTREEVSPEQTPPVETKPPEMIPETERDEPMP